MDTNPHPPPPPPPSLFLFHPAFFFFSLRSILTLREAPDLFWDFFLSGKSSWGLSAVVKYGLWGELSITQGRSNLWNYTSAALGRAPLAHLFLLVSSTPLQKEMQQYVRYWTSSELILSSGTLLGAYRFYSSSKCSIFFFHLFSLCDSYLCLHEKVVVSVDCTSCRIMPCFNLRDVFVDQTKEDIKSGNVFSWIILVTSLDDLYQALTLFALRGLYVLVM